MDEVTSEKCCTEPSTSETNVEPHNQLNTLYDRFQTQQKELERLEEQNGEYREKLLRVMREKDATEEMLGSIREEHRKQIEELSLKLRNSEVQVNALQDKTSAQEAHFNVTMRDLSLKYNNSVGQLTKKADIAEKDKNDAVIKYAMKETEIMRLRADLQTKENALKECAKAKNELENSQDKTNLDQMERMINTLKVDMERVKQEKFDCENKWKMAEKRAEASQTTISELKQQSDTLRKQIFQFKDEREEMRRKINSSQQVESRLQTESDEKTRAADETERRLRDVSSERDRLKEELSELNKNNEETIRENLALLSKLQDLEDKLQSEEYQHDVTRKELGRLQGIEKQVKRSQQEAASALKVKEEAESERDTAEKEAEECRAQAERMLAITEQLSAKNCELLGQIEQFRSKNMQLEQKAIEVEGELSRVSSKLSGREEELSKANAGVNEEVEQLTTQLNEKIAEAKLLSTKLNEEKNDFAAYKRKQAANIKEMKHELSALRRQAESHVNGNGAGMVASFEQAPSSSSRSRASSLTSLDRATMASREEESTPPKAEEQSITINQAMIDKIVLLQKKLARRNEKIEFLDEHVRQCLEELQKKTKIIQYYALREEASLLMPADNSLDEVPIAKSGSSYALMGSFFSSVGEKKSTQLVTEINSRLQAVLEDTLMKNITLKQSVDSLGNEVSKLSRENRQLLLMQSKDL